MPTPSTAPTPNAAPCPPRPLLERTVGGIGVLDLPIAQHRALDPEALRDISGAARLGDLRPSVIAEQPAFADLVSGSIDELREHGVEAHALGRELLTAVEQRQVLWLAEVAPSQVARLQRLFSPDVLRRVDLPREPEVAAALAGGRAGAAGPPGGRAEAAGLPDGRGGGAGHSDGREELAVVALNPLTLVERWCKAREEHRAYLREALQGADTLTMPRRVIHTLRRAGAGIIERSPLLRAARSPVVIAYAVVLIYSALRALPVMFVPRFHGHVWVLWSIDLVTAIPYTWGVIAMVAARRAWRRLIGLLVAVGTFVAPYVYFWSHGRDYPMLVNAVVIGLILAAIGLEAGRAWRERVIRAGLRGGITA